MTRYWPARYLLASGLLYSLLGGPIAAQSSGGMADRCMAAGGDSMACLDASVAARGLSGVVGLSGGSGAEIPGTATTLGTRVGGGPRFAFFTRVGVLDAGLPAITPEEAGDEVKFGVSALHIGAALGIFDGFRIMPTVGGFLSADLFGQAAFTFLPESEGFESGTTTFTGGVRIGVIREGFTVPGLSVSAARRFPGKVTWAPSPGGTEVEVDPGVTSVRALLSKDLFAVELLAGWGWDDYSGDAVITAPAAVGDVPVTVTEEAGGSRQLWFGGASMTFGLVLTIALEAGWTTGYDSVPGYVGSHAPTAGGPFGSLAVRLTL